MPLLPVKITHDAHHRDPREANSEKRYCFFFCPSEARKFLKSVAQLGLGATLPETKEMNVTSLSEIPLRLMGKMRLVKKSLRIIKLSPGSDYASPHLVSLIILTRGPTIRGGRQVLWGAGADALQIGNPSLQSLL